jgi:hypothetical protein
MENEEMENGKWKMKDGVNFRRTAHSTLRANNFNPLLRKRSNIFVIGPLSVIRISMSSVGQIRAVPVSPSFR